MMWIVGLIVVLLLVGAILYVNSSSSENKRTRESFLEEFTQQVDGRIEEVEGYKNSFRIYFEFEGYNGTSWDTLDIQSGIIPIQDVWVDYSFSNSTAYEKYQRCN